MRAPVHLLIYRPLLHRDWHWLASKARNQNEFSLVSVWANTDLGTDTDWNARYPQEQSGSEDVESRLGSRVPSQISVVCGFDDAAVTECIRYLNDNVPGGLAVDPPMKVLRVSRHPFDAAARLRGWSSGFRCTSKMAEAARARGLETQKVVGGVSESCIAGHQDARIVVREAVYLALDDHECPAVRDVGRLGEDAGEVLVQARRIGRLIDNPAELPPLNATAWAAL